MVISIPIRTLNDVTEKASDISNDSEDYDAGLVRAEGDALDRVIAFYDADIKFLDYCLGIFFEWLGERSDLDRCIIVLTSDHGERLGERGLLGHQLGLDNVLLHVPLIVRYPPLVNKGRYSQQVQSHHVFELVLNLISKARVQGRPKEVANLKLSESPIAVAQMRYQGGYLESLKKRNPQIDIAPYEGDWYAASDGKLKLWHSTSGTIRLYDLLEDPSEQNDVSGKLPSEVARLLPAVDALPEFSSGKKAKNVPAHLLELLKSLGYIHK
ncbi:MAG: sulfatase-like hydrolase/transferase [Clostridiales bacterium]|nr:sulfatase-like hydrolase/transferase [Clostridiales bacterium]